MDLDGSGTIERNELKKLIEYTVKASPVVNPDIHIELEVEEFFFLVDENMDNSISFEEFQTALKKFPHLINFFTVGLKI
jgi:Ca2+-binding EF-hand superfamily protein